MRPGHLCGLALSLMDTRTAKEQHAMTLNKYAAKCCHCGDIVPAQTGKLFSLKGKWLVTHPDCTDDIKLRGLGRYDLNGGEPKHLHYITMASGQTFTQNVNGRCIDAPCCGCCT